MRPHRRHSNRKVHSTKCPHIKKNKNEDISYWRLNSRPKSSKKKEKEKEEKCCEIFDYTVLV